MKGVSLSRQSIWVWPDAKHDLLFHFTLSTVALPPRATSILVRFNGVYSEVTLGTFSIMPPPPPCIPWMHEWDHKVNGAVSMHVVITHTLCLYHPPPLPCWCFHPKIKMSAFDYLTANSSYSFPPSMHPMRHTDPLFASSSPVGTDVGGWVARAQCKNWTKTECWSPGCEKKWTSLYE